MIKKSFGRYHVLAASAFLFVSANVIRKADSFQSDLSSSAISLSGVAEDEDVYVAGDFEREIPSESNQLGNLDRTEIQLEECYANISSDPQGVLEFAASLDPSDARNNLIVDSISEWAMRDPLAALEWVNESSEESLKPKLIGRVAISWSEFEPAEAADLALSTIESSRVRDRTVIGIVQRWIQNDPESAVYWVSTLPPSLLRDATLDVLATSRLVP